MPKKAKKKEAEDLLKNPSGQYKTDVRARCKMLYFEGYTTAEIEGKTDVPQHALHKWIYGRKELIHSKGWMQQRKDAIAEIKEKNIESLSILDGKILEILIEFLGRIKEEGGITSSKELKSALTNSDIIADIRKKIFGDPDKGVDTQVNVMQQNIQPLDPDLAMKAILNDPIRRKPPPDWKDSE